MKIVHFFTVNQDVVLVSLMRKVIFSAACANDLIKRPVAFGRKLSILKPNKCKILQLLNAKRKLTNSTRAFDSRRNRHEVQSAQGPWCRSSLDEMHKWSRGATVAAAILLHLDGPVVQSGPRSSSILMDQPSSSTPIVHSLTSLISPLDIQKTDFSFCSGLHQCTFYLHFHCWHVNCKFEDSSKGDNLSWGYYCYISLFRWYFC